MSSNPTVLSGSSVQTYLRCGQMWYFAYVEAIKAPPTLKQTRGTAVHKAVEVNMRQKVTTRVDMPVEDVADAFSTAFDAESPLIEEDRLQIPAIKDAGVKLIRLHSRFVAPEIQPVWVEQAVQFELNGLPFSGQVDLLDEMQRVRDTKTTARKPSGKDYALSMTGYALAYRQLTGKIETDTVLDYLVATTRPYYLPVAAGGSVTDAQIQRFANVVESVSGAIQAGRFVPNGLINGTCNFCGYRNICPAYDQRQLLELELGE